MFGIECVAYPQFRNGRHKMFTDVTRPTFPRAAVGEGRTWLYGTFSVDPNAKQLCAKSMNCLFRLIRLYLLFPRAKSTNISVY